jgi:hypothetical protein
MQALGEQMQPSSTSIIQPLGRSRFVWRVGSTIVLLALGMISIDFLLTVYCKFLEGMFGVQNA